MNRYFYRVVAVSPAGVRSAPGPSSPPIYIPKVTPPEPPNLTHALSGDRKVVLRWRHGADDGLKAYHVYRAETPEAARDIRLMQEIATVDVEEHHEPGDELTYDDEQVAGPTTYYYRLTVKDTEDNESDASPVLSTRPHAAYPPPPPEWEVSAWNTTNGQQPPAIVLRWKAAEAGMKALLQRYEEDEMQWYPVTGWLRSSMADGRTFTYRDEDVTPEGYYEYRVKVIDAYGLANAWYQTQIVLPLASP